MPAVSSLLKRLMPLDKFGQGDYEGLKEKRRNEEEEYQEFISSKVL
jgi:hypothetical protein